MGRSTIWMTQGMISSSFLICVYGLITRDYCQFMFSAGIIVASGAILIKDWLSNRDSAKMEI
jgi:hypothetical protein